MNWYTIKKEFNKKYPGYTVKVEPPCISDTRHTHYCYDVMAYAIGKKSTVQGCVVGDKEKKVITLYR